MKRRFTILCCPLTTGRTRPGDFILSFGEWEEDCDEREPARVQGEGQVRTDPVLAAVPG